MSACLIPEKLSIFRTAKFNKFCSRIYNTVGRSSAFVRITCVFPENLCPLFSPKLNKFCSRIHNTVARSSEFNGLTCVNWKFFSNVIDSFILPTCVNPSTAPQWYIKKLSSITVSWRPAYSFTKCVCDPTQVAASTAM